MMRIIAIIIHQGLIIPTGSIINIISIVGRKGSETVTETSLEIDITEIVVTVMAINTMNDIIFEIIEDTVLIRIL